MRTQRRKHLKIRYPFTRSSVPVPDIYLLIVQLVIMSRFGPEDFPVSPDPGYFVYLTDDTSFTVSGVVLGEKTVSINKGWNFIG